MWFFYVSFKLTHAWAQTLHIKKPFQLCKSPRNSVSRTIVVQSFDQSPWNSASQDHCCQDPSCRFLRSPIRSLYQVNTRTANMVYTEPELPIGFRSVRTQTALEPVIFFGACVCVQAAVEWDDSTHLNWHLLWDLWDPGPLVPTVTTSWPKRKEEETRGRRRRRRRRRREEEGVLFWVCALTRLQTFRMTMCQLWKGNHFAAVSWRQLFVAAAYSSI